ncbi:hypothetical protein GPJ56_002990 [Histomonas meleagridis]|uniref:uncharacterized protein n=1 Tax=Histomonas meleagridis TaxID=135588 RepID=UPI00355A1AC5|nr:hypothetical protein GPJ56_002990 [Histomonas meleagridis]KAH0796647.1 hypothetical protein GO595_010540 [Histomonas meleagridis]
MNGQELLGSYERAKDKISKLMEQIEHQQQDSSYVMTQLAMSIYEFTSLSKLFQNAPTDIINIIEGNISIVINICINYELGDESCKYEILNAKNEIEKNLLKMESFVKGYQQNIPLNDVNSPEIAYAMSQFDESLLIKNDESSSQDDKGYIKLAKSWSNKLRDYIKGCSNSMLSGSIHHGSVGSLGDLGVPTLYNVNSFVSFQISNHSSDHSLGGRSPPDNMLEDVPIHNKNVKNVINQQQQKPPAAQQPPKPPTAQQSAPKNVTITQQPPKPASVQQQTPPTKNVTTAQQAPQPPKPATVPQPAPQQAPQPASNAPAQQQKSVTTSTAHQTPQPSQPPPATATTANQTQQPPDLSRKPTPVPMQAPTIIQPSPVVAITPTPTAAAVNVPSATPKIIQIPATQQYILPPPSKPPLPPPKQSMPPPKQPFAGGGTSIDVSLAPAPSLSMFKKPVGPNTQKK